MARSYRHIQKYEKEILELKGKGLTQSEIARRLGFTKEQVRGFFKRLHRKERRIEAGEVLRRKGRPPKDDKFSETDKVNELKYIIARKPSVYPVFMGVPAKGMDEIAEPIIEPPQK